MNKTEFIKALVQKTGYDEAKCAQINSILEDTFIIGKEHRAELVQKFQEQMQLTADEAESLYEDVMGLVGTGIKDKLKHPFGSSGGHD